MGAGGCLAVSPPRPPEVHGHPDRSVHQLFDFSVNAEHVGDEELGDGPLVVVVDLERAVEPAHGVAHGRLGLDHHERQPVHQQHEVGAALVGARTKHKLVGDDVVVVLGVLGVEQAHGDVLVVRPKRHRAVAAHPGRQLLVGLDQPVGAHGEHDGAQLVEHLVSAVGNGGDLGVEPEERLTHPRLGEELVGETWDVRRGPVMPAEATQLAVAAGEAGADGRVVGAAAGEEVADEGLNGGGFGEH